MSQPHATIWPPPLHKRTPGVCNAGAGPVEFLTLPPPLQRSASSARLRSLVCNVGRRPSTYHQQHTSPRHRRLRSRHGHGHGHGDRQSFCWHSGCSRCWRGHRSCCHWHWGDRHGGRWLRGSRHCQDGGRHGAVGHDGLGRGHGGSSLGSRGSSGGCAWAGAAALETGSGGAAYVHGLEHAPACRWSGRVGRRCWLAGWLHGVSSGKAGRQQTHTFTLGEPGAGAVPSQTLPLASLTCTSGVYQTKSSHFPPSHPPTPTPTHTPIHPPRLQTATSASTRQVWLG